MNILIAVVASSAGVFATVTSMRAITCARLQREFRAYATWDDGAPAVAELSQATSGPSDRPRYALAGLRVVVATASSTASSQQ
jgi:hypothetical protein